MCARLFSGGMYLHTDFSSFDLLLNGNARRKWTCQLKLGLDNAYIQNSRAETLFRVYLLRHGNCFRVRQKSVWRRRRRIFSSEQRTDKNASLVSVSCCCCRRREMHELKGEKDAQGVLHDEDIVWPYVVRERGRNGYFSCKSTPRCALLLRINRCCWWSFVGGLSPQIHLSLLSPIKWEEGSSPSKERVCVCVPGFWQMLYVDKKT